MATEFARVITLLRNEKGISQKKAASDLGVSQALLSHYERGIRQCSLEFVVRSADYYNVSCDYLLGRSPDPNGSTLTLEDIPEPELSGTDNRGIGALLPQLNKKLISNSLNVLYDLLIKTDDKNLTREISQYLMLAVYRVFRMVYSINKKNPSSLFNVPERAYLPYSSASMEITSANAHSIAQGKPLSGGKTKFKNMDALALDTEIINQNYPMAVSSLLNLIQSAENAIDFQEITEQKSKSRK